MANNDYITTDCKLTVSKNTAKLDEEIFLYKNDRNIKLLIEIVDNKYRYKSDDLSNLLVKYKASYAQVKWYKNAEVKKEFPIQATDDGKVVFVIEGQLIDEDTELGDYDLQLRLLNESQESIRSLPIIKGAVHILKPLFEEGDIATVNSAVADVSMLSLDGDAIDTYNSDGTYNQTNWGNGDVISSAKLNKLEKVAKDNVDKVNKMPAKSIVEGGKIYLAKEDGTKLDSGTELPAGGSTIEVVNNLESDSTTAALSAAQGKVLNTQYKDLASKIGSGSISNAIEPQLMDMPRIYFSEGTLPTSKTATMLKFDYYSKTKEYHGWAEIKCQGTSSMSYPKKNFTIKLYKDKDKAKKLEIDFKGWGAQSKFCLKANWIDITHARNVVSAKIWGDVVKTRNDYTNLPELLRTSPNQGAIDGFSIIVYGNGGYQGRYTLNIPKDKWMSNMDDALDTHCILCGENYQSGCFRALPQINGSDWTDELHDVVPATIKTSWTNVIKFVMNSTDAEFKANLGNYFDVNSLIDYLLYGIVSTGLDAFGKNQIYMTYDGIKWIASMYDMDSTWGLWWNGSKFVATDYAREEFQDLKDEGNGVVKQGNLLYLRLQNLFVNEIKSRYTELRQNIFTYPYLINKFEEFIQICHNEIVKEDYASTTGEGKFTSIPLKEANNIQQLRSYINARLTYVDSYINSLVEPIPCTAITLDKSTLSFTTADAQTLTATVTPTDTTNPIVWSVSPSGICSIENGVVTPITSSGNCIITATCGEKTATCNVNVNVDLSVKGLTLNKESTNLTISTVDESTVNLLEGIGHDKKTGDIVFDEVTLSPGTYVIKNINQGNFQYLGYYVGDAKYSQDVSTTDECKLIVSETANIKVKLYNGNSTAVDGNIGLFKTKSLNVITTSTPFVYESDGAINSPTSTDSQTSQVVTLDTNKQYIIRKTTQGIDQRAYLCYRAGNNSTNWIRISDLGCESIGIIENASSIQISYKKDELSSIELVEVDVQDSSSSTVYGTDTLTATLTPSNAINKNVTWSVDNDNVELITDGLNCTVKAKIVGNSVVTCTSQDTTNGTISDTCNVTIS